MIHVNAYLGDGVTRIDVSGHEEHLHDGRVCAAVSWITQTALLGLEQVAATYPDLVQVTITKE